MGFIAAMICYGLIWLTGCTSPGSNQSEWHPETKMEMRKLIGQTTMDAMHQYRIKRQQHMPMSTKPRKGMNLDPRKLIPPDQRS